MRPEDEAWFRNDGTYQHKDAPGIGGSKSVRRQSVEMFMEECCVMEEGAFTPASALNDALSRWRVEKGRGSIGQRQLIAELIRLGGGRIERWKAGGIRGLRGVRLASP